MPHTNVGRDPVKEHHAVVENVVRQRMAGAGIKRQKTLSQKIKMSESVLSRRFSDGTWSLDEMIKIAQTLHMSEHDAAVILGVGGKT